jgi:hypothetical protein
VNQGLGVDSFPEIAVSGAGYLRSVFEKPDHTLNLYGTFPKSAGVYASISLSHRMTCHLSAVRVKQVVEHLSNTTKVDRLDVAGGLNPGLSEPGN